MSLIAFLFLPLETHIFVMVMHLTQVYTRCSITAWKNTPRRYLSLNSNLTQKKPVANTFLGCDGLMDFGVPNVSIIRPGKPEESYFNAKNVDIRIQ